jgi:hypothetical protein
MEKKILSEKRIELLKIIDKYGILTRKQIHEHVNIAEINLFKGIKKLQELEFIGTYKLARGYAHYITKKGSEYIGTLNFGYVKSGGSPNLAILEHNLLVNDCIFQAISNLKSRGIESEIQILTEREQLAEIFLTLDLSRGNASQKKSQKMRVRNRIPDFVLIFDYGEKEYRYVYEVELSRKNTARLKNKFLWLKDQLISKNYSNINYMCRDEKLENYLKQNADKVGLPLDFLRIEEKEDIK